MTDRRVNCLSRQRSSTHDRLSDGLLGLALLGIPLGSIRPVVSTSLTFGPTFHSRPACRVIEGRLASLIEGITGSQGATAEGSDPVPCVVRAREGFQSRIVCERQRLEEGPLAVFGRENLDAPGAIESHLTHGADETGDILGSVADQGATVPGVFEEGPDRVTVGVAQLDAEDDVRVETPTSSGSVVPARNTCQKSTSSPADGWSAARIRSAPCGMEPIKPKGSGSIATRVPTAAASLAIWRSGSTNGVMSSTGDPNAVPILMNEAWSPSAASSSSSQVPRQLRSSRHQPEASSTSTWRVRRPRSRP